MSGIKGLLIFSCVTFLLSCGKKEISNPPPPAAVSKDFPQWREVLMSDAKNLESKYHYDVACIGDGLKIPVLLTLRSQGKGKDNAVKVTDWDALVFYYQEKDGNLEPWIIEPFNIKAKKKLKLKGGESILKSYTSWNFLLHISSSHPFNYRTLIVDRSVDSKGKESVQASFVASPLFKEELDPFMKFTCPIFHLK